MFLIIDHINIPYSILPQIRHVFNRFNSSILKQRWVDESQEIKSPQMAHQRVIWECLASKLGSKMFNDSLAEMIDPARREYFNICFNGKHQLDCCCVWDMGNNRCSCTLTWGLLFVTPTNTTKNWQGGYLWMFVPNPNYCSWEDRRHVQELLHEFWTVVGLQAFRNKSNISDLFQHVLWSTENIYDIYIILYIGICIWNE